MTFVVLRGLQKFKCSPSNDYRELVAAQKLFSTKRRILEHSRGLSKKRPILLNNRKFQEILSLEKHLFYRKILIGRLACKQVF